MNWWGSGFVPIIIYSTTSGEIVVQANTILTENNFDITTEAAQELLTET
jgi:hypothetical protein